MPLFGDSAAANEPRNIQPPAEPVQPISSHEVVPEISSAKTPKLPAFWKDEPEIWFLQVEASFRVCGISQDTTKFEYLIMNLDQSVLFLVKDIVVSPPPSGKYDMLKKRIMDSFAESAEQQLKRLLSGIEIGDLKPSHYLHRMKSLSGGKISTDILKTLFLERLPDKVKSILAVCESNDVDKLALQADKIVEAFSSSTSMFVSEVTSHENVNDFSNKLDAIIARIDVLETRSRSSQRDSQSSFRPRSRSRGVSTSRNESGMCWYHWRFADKARKCIQPCNYNNSKN